MSRDHILKRSLDRYIAPEDFQQLDLDIREEPKVPPSVGIFDSPYRCYIINHEWDAHIAGAISALAEWRAWVGDDDERATAVQEVLKLLGHETDCSMTFQLRQNPDNPCQLQQSFDGTTWTLAYDYSFCNSLGNATEAFNEALAQLEALLAQYDGTVTSVAPDMVYDSTDDDAIRDLALCHVCKELIDSLCQAEIEYRSPGFTVLKIMGAIGTLIGILITIGTLGTGTPLYISISFAIAGAVGSILGALSEEVLRDTDARDNLACCMYNNLKGATIDKTSFEASLTGCEFAGGSNEDQLVGAISGWLSDDDVYESFLDALQRSYKLAELGIADCPCEESGEWEWNSEFETSQGGWIPNVRDSLDYAVYTPSVGWEVANINTSPTSYQNFISIEVNFATPVIVTTAIINYNTNKGTSVSTARQTWRAYLGEDIVMEANNDDASGTSLEMSIAPNALVDRIYLSIRASSGINPTDGYSGTASINQITLTGDGTIPVELV